MNHAYRLVWNPSQQSYVPAPETARGHRKQDSRTKCSLVGAAVAAAFLSTASGVHALPTAAQVSSGSASLALSGSTLTVSQSTPKLALNWQSFGIAANETVNFVQPNASAVALNRVLGSDASAIYGKLNANGQVFLINPNGVLFGKSAEVNVGGLAASTLNLSDADFVAGKNRFSGNGGDVTNLGSIKADGGYIAFLGGQVSNRGTLQANLGTVALAAGNQATLDFNGDKLIKVQVDRGALNALAENRQLVQADGGTVILSARAADGLVSAVVNNTGLIRARTLENRGGVITLLGDMQHGVVNVGGTLDASAPNGGNGGFIETSAAQVRVADDARVTTLAPLGKTGTWLVDPQDYTVAASGGDISGATLSSSLGTTDVTLQSSSGATAGAGNVNVNDAVTWSANTILTLTASNHVNVNSTITATGASAGLNINPNTANGGQTASGAGTFNLGSGASINLPNVSPTSATALVIAGTPYSVINSLGTAGDTSATTLQGINGNLAGHYALGSNIDATATAAWNSSAGFLPIGNATTTFTGTFDGLGHTISGLTINRPFSDNIGLFGYVGSTGMVQNIGLLGGNINGNSYVGGLVGWSYGRISNAYTTGKVSGYGYEVGGLVGENDGTIGNAYATGYVGGGSGNYEVGGLVGENDGTIINAYATGGVSGTNLVGGLVGWNISAISNAYATGSVSGNNSVGGLAGKNNGTVSNGYWNKDIKATGIGGGTTTGVTGLTTAQMRTASNFTGLAFTTTPGASGWVIVDGDGTLNNAGGAAGATTPMLASEYSTTVNNTHQLQLMAMAPAASYTLGRNIYAFTSGTDVWGSSGFAPIGNLTIPFTGIFDGRNQTISSLTVSAPASNYMGLFGVVGVGGTVQNLGLVGDSISGSKYTGGLVGRNEGTISNVYVTSYVSGSNDVGGLVGYNTGTIRNVYASGSVSGTSLIGGLVGNNDGTISNAYATSSVNGTTLIGGLVANNNAGTVASSFWNTTTSGQAASDGGIGLTTAQIQTLANFTSATGANGNVNPAWDLNNTWVMYDGHTAPLLRSFMTPLTVTANSGSKTYNGQVYSAYGVSYSGTPNGNLLGAVSYGGSAQNATNAGTYIIAPSGLYSNQQGYIIGYVNNTLTINPASLTVLGTTAANKVYDSSTTASLSGGTLSGLIAGDAVALTQSGIFATKNAGTGIAVTATDSLTGAAAGNYTLIQPSGLNASITPKALTVVGTVAANKAYDGTTTAALSGGSLNGVIAGDTVALAQSGIFATKNAGTGIVVTATDTLSGSAASNYTLIEPSGLSASITPKLLTVAGTTLASNKIYDATTSATVSGGSIGAGGIIAGDAVNLTQAGSFASKNVGTAKTVTYSNTLSGTDAGNYSLSATGGTTTANITAKALTVNNSLAANKVYDGTTTAKMSLTASLAGLLDGDTVDIVQNGKFADKNIGNYKTVTYSNTLIGADAGNYSLSAAGGILYANIAAKALTVTGTTVGDKVYDGTTKASLKGGKLNGLISGDLVTLAQSGVFATRNAGIGITVTATDSLVGTAAGNYTLTQPTTLAANITPKTLTVTGTKVLNKVYDATTAAVISVGNITGLIAGDAVTLVQSGTFADKNVGSGKVVNFSNNLTGIDAGNYILKSQFGTAKAKIFALQLAVDESYFAAASKIYDGTTAATVSGATIDGVLSGDTANLVQSGTFANKNIGTDKVVNYKYRLTGKDAKNYSLNIKGGKTLADITEN